MPLVLLGSTFKNAKIVWSTLKKEAFAIFQGFTRLDYLLLSKERTKVYTDHRNVLFVFEPLSLDISLERHIGTTLLRLRLFLARLS